LEREGKAKKMMTRRKQRDKKTGGGRGREGRGNRKREGVHWS
jgi:ribosomal protein L15